jgi:hypothetical protein
MTDLSSAAQAVLDAYQFAPIEDHLTAADVLKAAALYCKRDRLQLLALAEELEACALDQYKINGNEGIKTQ